MILQTTFDIGDSVLVLDGSLNRSLPKTLKDRLPGVVQSFYVDKETMANGRIYTVRYAFPDGVFAQNQFRADELEGVVFRKQRISKIL